MKLSKLLTCTCRKVKTGMFHRFLHEGIWKNDHTVVSEASIKDKLTSLSVPFTEGYACFLVKNCFCQNNQNLKNKNDIFINKRTGSFLCQECRLVGEWNTYTTILEKAKDNLDEAQFSLNSLPKYDESPHDWFEVSAKTTPLINLSDSSYEQVISEFGLQHFTRVVANKLHIRISHERDVLYFPLHCEFPTVVGYKTYEKDGTEKTFPRKDCPGFLLYSRKPKTAVIIVANIPDFLALTSKEISDYDIVCLQYGTSHLPQATLPFFERYKKIILWLGEKNLDSTGNILSKLNKKRCYVVRPIENQISASIALSKQENFKDILTEAKLAWHPSITTFSSFRDQILGELQNKDEVAGIPWKRFPLLTKILKGHRRGELTVLTGPTGVGKTTFLSEYSLDLAIQGVNTLWCSFEIKNSRLAKIMLTQFLRAALPTNLTEYNSICNKFEELPIFFLSLHGQQHLSRVMDALNHCSYLYDIAHVIIDNIQFMIDVSEQSQMDRFLKQDYMIQEFRSFATRNNCHVTIVMHPKKIEGFDLGLNSVFGGVKATQEADNVIIIQKREYSSFKNKKFLQVSKNRFSGDLGLFALDFDKTSLCFSRSFEKDIQPQEKEETFSESKDWLTMYREHAKF